MPALTSPASTPPAGMREGTTWPPVLLALLVTAIHLASAQAGALTWVLPSGITFVALWMLPTRAWPWIVLAAVLGNTGNGLLRQAEVGNGLLQVWPDPWLYALDCVARPLLNALAVGLLRRWGHSPSRLHELECMRAFLLAAALAALALAAKDVAYVLLEGRLERPHLASLFSLSRQMPDLITAALVTYALMSLLAHFFGIVLVAPLAAWALVRDHRPGSLVLLGFGLRWLLPALLVFVLALRLAPVGSLIELLRLALMGIAVLFALYHGWRGAALASLMVGIAVAIEVHGGLTSDSPVRLQAMVALTAATTLLLGATIGGLRRQRRALLQANHQADLLSRELRAAASRNLQVEERERSRLAAELHDEFGQTLTALQTHLKLAAPALDAIGQAEASRTLMELTRTMRLNISRVLEALHPAALEELGLYAAIDRGSVRRLAEAAGLRFDAWIEGDARLLGALQDTHRVAAYRLVQEAVTNIIRHAQATRCEVRMRVSHRQGLLWLFLDVRDDGRASVEALRPGRGLISMRDRALALDGRLHLHDLSPGLRLHAVLRQRLSLVRNID